MNPLDPLQEIAEKCTKCGLCQTVCPVFAEIQKEAAVARGKVRLIGRWLSGEPGFSKKLSTYLLQCLGCGACSENCPNGVKADELILAARARLVEKKGLSLPKWVILRKLLGSPSLLPMLLKTGSLLQALLLKRVPKESGLHLRFSLPYLDKERLIPSIQTPFFLERHPARIIRQGRAERVGVFAGCSIQYLFPSIGEATLRLLRRNHFSVDLPRDQTCCGLPAYGSGDLETARNLARRNLMAFADLKLDRVLVPCASCFYFLKEGYPKLFPGDENVRSFSEKVVEPSTFFLEHRGLTTPRENSQDQGQRIRVTYHDPCHLRRGMKIFQEPRRLLQSLPGIELVEMNQPDRCCGLGGSFNFIYYDLSRQIVKRKVEDIDSTGAEVVATSCMGCMIQLRDGLHHRGKKTNVAHVVEVLDRATSTPEPGEEGS